MNLIAKTMGALALTLLNAVIVLLINAVLLWVLLPAAFPVMAGYSFYSAFCLAGLLFLARGIFK